MDETDSMLAKTPNVCRLDIGDVFEGLTKKERLFAHHMARAVWNGTRIILRQVSPESGLIFDFIINLYDHTKGDWEQLRIKSGISSTELDSFLNYCALFLGNIGNYYGHGDQKFIPGIDQSIIKKFATYIGLDNSTVSQLVNGILSTRDATLGYPGDQSQSTYYTGSKLSREQIVKINKVLDDHNVHPDNTRIHYDDQQSPKLLSILQASMNLKPVEHLRDFEDYTLQLQRGDHNVELDAIYKHLEEAKKFASNSLQKEIISLHQQTFKTGDIENYKNAQRLWVKDIKPNVESVLGFVEPYRDPSGVRSEFEGLVAIVDEEETKILSKLVFRSAEFVKVLPWVTQDGQSSNGPFERQLFDPPDYTSLHVLAYCSSIIFLGINLPNYNDIRQTVGFKNLMIANRNQPLGSSDAPPFVHPCEASTYVKHAHSAWKLQISLHELFGHGTGQLLMQNDVGDYNFSIEKPPFNPLTGQSIVSWYRKGENWNNVFGDIAATVDECRAELVGSFLICEKEILDIFGYVDDSDITADDIIYNLYLQLGVLGLRSLESYSVDDQKWTQAHDRGHFAMFRTLLHAPDFMTITFNANANTLHISIDRSKILSHGRPALSSLLLKLHIWRCTADVKACRTFYEELTTPNEQHLEWRKVVMAKQKPRQIFVQANTYIDESGEVQIREYEKTVEGMLRSWGERERLLRGLDIER